jgi:hypothetical protein
VNLATISEWRRKALILTCAFAVALSLAIRGNSCGHDFDFHIQSWMAVAQQWRHDVLYPHWIESANYGAGEPRFIFYPPISWMLGALLGMALPWSAAPVAFTFIVMTASGFTMNKLAREYLPPHTATIATCAYILNPYALFVAYERTAYGELAAAIWLPLIVLYATKTSPHPAQNAINPRLYPRRITPLALSIAAIWLTNAPAAVMACYLLAAITLWQSIAQKRLQPILHATAGLALGLGLAAFYLVPAAYERRWVQIARAVGPGMRIQDSFLFGHMGESFHDHVLHTASWIFVTMLATIVVAGAIAWRQHRSRRLLIALFVTAAALLAMQLPASALVWAHAPELQFLQFPWRLTLVLSVAFAVALGVAISQTAKRPTRPKVAAGILLAFAAALSGSWLFWQPCDEEDVVSAQLTVFQSGGGFQGTDEYTPIGADNSEVPPGLPQVRLLKSADAEIAASPQPDADAPAYAPTPQDQIPGPVAIQQWQPETKIFTTTAEARGYAVLRLMDYPAWLVRANGQIITNRPHRDDGLVVIPIPSGKTTITVTYTTTSDVVWARRLTAASLLALVAMGIVRKRSPASF